MVSTSIFVFDDPSAFQGSMKSLTETPLCSLTGIFESTLIHNDVSRASSCPWQIYRKLGVAPYLCRTRNRADPHIRSHSQQTTTPHYLTHLLVGTIERSATTMAATWYVGLGAEILSVLEPTVEQTCALRRFVIEQSACNFGETDGQCFSLERNKRLRPTRFGATSCLEGHRIATFVAECDGPPDMM